MTSPGAPEEIPRDDLLNHYQRVKEVILQYANFNGTFKALIRNHTGWWRVDRIAGTCRFFYPDEDGYNAVIKGCRALYWTTQNFFPPTANIVEEYDKERHRPVKAIGTREDMAYISFILDLDIEGGYDIFNPEAKKWVEEGINFFGKKLLDAGIESFGLAFSGNGGYCMLHPQCGEVGENEKDREFTIKVIQRAFDLFIDAVAKEFFAEHPEAERYIRFDELNYSRKRQLKTICSIHKKFAHIVTPLDKYNAVIDLNEAKLPISDEIIEKSKNWLTYHEGDYDRMPEILKPYMGKAEEEEKANKPSDYSNEHEPIIPDKVAPVESWAPCMKYIYNKVDWEGKGATRSLGVFAAFLRMIGMPRTDALKIWQPKAQKWGVDDWERVFETLYDCKHGDGKLKNFVPTCEHIQRVGSGYPKLYLGGLGVCNPDARCRQIKHPLAYHQRQHGASEREGSIPLKYDGNELGVLKIKRAANDRLLVSIDGDKITLAEKNVPLDFYSRGWYQDRVFKDIKYGLEDNDFQNFLKDVSTEIENAIESLPEDELEGAEYSTKGELEDGRFYEEIFRDGKEQFVVYDSQNNTYEYVREIDSGGEIIFPRPIDEKERSSLMLADGVEEYGSLADLRKDMLSFALEEFDPVDNLKVFELVILLELTTWIASERMANLIEKFIPILSARGGSETGKKRFLTVARWLTYRSMYFLKTTKVPTIFRYLSPWGGTLILDEADLGDSRENSDFVEFMNSRADGVPIPRYNSKKDTVELFYSFGMTVLAERSPAADDGYESRKIIFASDATENPEDYSLIPPKEWGDKGKVLLRKLLMFRLKHLKGEMPSNLTIPNVQSFRVRESLLLLQSLVDEDAKIEKAIRGIAKDLEARIVVERSNSLDGLIVNTVYGAVVDDEGYVEQHGVNFEIMRNHRGSNPDGTGNYTTPLTLKTISKSIGEVLSAFDIARRWRGLGQGTRGAAKIDGKRYRGIIQIQNVKRFRKELRKYVVEIDSEELDSKLKIQETLETGGDEEW